MKLKAKVVTLLAGIILSSYSSAFADAAPLKDINYKFDQAKINSSEDAFHLMRSFVDYYFKLIAKNPNSLHLLKKTKSYAGWCVGDAHPENFGILLQDNGKALFTMNDMDDSGPCPVILDFFRILVSSRLYMPKIDIHEIIESYLAGLKNKEASLPGPIKSMTLDALKKGHQIAAKDLQGNALKRKADISEVDPVIKTQITSLLQENYRSEDLRVLDVIGTSKVAGGSGGLQRYRVLITNTKQELIQLELKELTTPSIASVATAAIPDQSLRMERALQVSQGQGFSHYYNVFKIQGKSMLLRPKFSGNRGVRLADSSDHDNLQIINFEAYLLGRLHSGIANIKDYRQALDHLSTNHWEEDISAVTAFFNQKFSELKKIKSE